MDDGLLRSAYALQQAGNLAEAARLYDEAVRANPRSFDALCLLALAQDAPEARIEAYKWYRLAAAQGYQGSAAASTALIYSMTREDVAIGDRRATAFMATEARVAET